MVLPKQLKKSRFMVERRIFQDYKYLRGYSRDQSNKWTDWGPYHDVHSVNSLGKIFEHCQAVANRSMLTQEFRIVNNYPSVTSQLQFSMLYPSTNTILEKDD